jgi:hypothetical protein
LRLWRLRAGTDEENDMMLGEKTSMGSGFAGSIKALLLMGSLVAGLTSCAGETSSEPGDEEVGTNQSALTSGPIGTPIQGQCTTTATINLVTLASGNVIRSTCSETCKKNAVKMGVYNLYTVLPGGGASAMVNNLGSGPTRSAQVDVPYVPGVYSVACVTQWQEKVGSTTYFDQGIPYTGGQF